MNASADWAFGILPLFIVWDLQLNRRTKALVVGILAFAAIGSTATIVRMKYIHNLINGPDFLWATTDVAMWSTIEPGIGITAASMATLRPLLQNCLYRLGLASEPSHHQPRQLRWISQSEQKRRSRHGHKDLGLEDLEPTQQVTASTTVSSPSRSVTVPPRSSASASAESLVITLHEYEQQMADAKDSGTPTGVHRSIFVEHNGAPKIPNFRNSFRKSFVVGSIFSSKAPRGNY